MRNLKNYLYYLKKGNLNQKPSCDKNDKRITNQKRNNRFVKNFYMSKYKQKIDKQTIK